MDLPLSPSMSEGVNIVLTWASSAHAKLNRILRSVDSVDDLYNTFPHAFIFTQQLIHFIYNHGFDKSRIGVNTLYRGYNKDYNLRSTIIDKGFISTSKELTVSEGFTDGRAKGRILSFAVSRLPSSVPFLIIDERFNRMFHESEVLMMPGKITIDLTTMESIYEMDKQFVDDIRSRTPPYLTDSDADGGGRRRKTKDRFAPCLPLESARGKRLLFYRAIQDRPVEVLGYIDCPQAFEEFRKVIRFDLPNMLNYYNRINDYIPEVQDMQVYFKKPKKSHAKYKRLLKRWNTFFVHFAIFNTVSNEVLSICGFEPVCLFEEVFESARNQEVIDAVIKYSTMSTG